MKINRVNVLECLVYIALVPFLMALTYDFIVFAEAARSSSLGGGADALALVVISTVTYCFACIISVPSIIHIFYAERKRNIKIKARLKFLFTLSLLVISLPPICIVLLTVNHA
jgi:hypothetical protein